MKKRVDLVTTYYFSIIHIPLNINFLKSKLNGKESLSENCFSKEKKTASARSKLRMKGTISIFLVTLKLLVRGMR